MSSKEEIEKAKEKLKKFCDYEDNLVLMDNVLYEYQDAIEILLQYIKELEADNYELNNRLNDYIENDKKQNKIIDEMAEQLAGLHDISESDCFIPREYSDIDDCVKKASCAECIKQYFEKKVEKEE